MSTTAPPAQDRAGAAPALPQRLRRLAVSGLSHQAAGPLIALVIAVGIFTAITPNYLSPANVSLLFQQSVVVGTLAIGQTLIILTSGIDLSIGAIMVLGTVLFSRFAVEGNLVGGLIVGVVMCAVLGALNGGIVALLKLPPFIVTLGMFTVIAAATRLYTNSGSYTVTDPALTLLRQGIRAGGWNITYGVMLWIALTLLMAYALNRTAWGTHVYAVGNDIGAARLNGVKTGRVLVSVYVVAGLIYAVAALQALSRTPIGDPSGYQLANLDSITAVVIGGTSLFGGRGGVGGTFAGALIVVVLQNGLTKAGIDSLYQQIAVGILVILAVAIDQIFRRRQTW